MTIQPFKTSKPRAVMTPFGAVMISGPFADDYTRLKWQFDDHWSGESARFRVAGLEAFVKDRDGDDSYWILKDVRARNIIAEGKDSGFDPPNFWVCLVRAEDALRSEVARRKTAIRGLTISTPGETAP